MKHVVPKTPRKLLFSSVYSGLLQSRLYGGSKLIGRFDTPSGLQDFRQSGVPGSLVNRFKSVGYAITISNGSSYAMNYLLTKQTRKYITPESYILGLRPMPQVLGGTKKNFKQKSSHQYN